MATLWRGQQAHHLHATDANNYESESAVRPESDRTRNLEDLSWLPERVGRNLLSLLEAHRYAIDLDVNDWGFSIRWPALHRDGLKETDVLWLVQAGLIDFAYEVSLPGELTRQFRRTEHLVYTDTLSFALTVSGVELTEAWLRSQPLTSHLCGAAAIASNRPTADPIVRIPQWDRDRQELCVGDVLVKRFKAPAANQETILAAFQEEQWPPRIDDPLSPTPEVEPKRRLHDTINSLNRNQKNQLLRFFGDGSGTGIRWEFVEDEPGTDALRIS